jgi:hypothetical protein
MCKVIECVVYVYIISSMCACMALGIFLVALFAIIDECLPLVDYVTFQFRI